ncbi:hypothetical protein HMI54_006365 [Coelomomyces lativittatus]|nr:hypothetical protein HMI54_006365 [Coelomomyces lativittatus]
MCFDKWKTNDTQNYVYLFFLKIFKRFCFSRVRFFIQFEKKKKKNLQKFLNTENRYQKVSKYAANEYKFTLDDSLRDILSDDFGLKISYTLTHLKLVLGFLASICGIGAAGYGHIYKDRPMHVLSFVMGYFFFSILLTYLSFFIEKNRVVIGHKNSLKVEFSTKFEPLHKNQYKVVVHATKGARKTKIEQALSISKLFTESGQLVGQEWYRTIGGWMQRIEKEMGNE